MPPLEPLEVWWTAPAGLGVLLLLSGLIFWAGARFGRATRGAASCDAYERGFTAGRTVERLASYQRRTPRAAEPVSRAATQRRAQGWAE